MKILSLYVILLLATNVASAEESRVSCPDLAGAYLDTQTGDIKIIEQGKVQSDREAIERSRRAGSIIKRNFDSEGKTYYHFTTTQAVRYLPGHSLVPSTDDIIYYDLVDKEEDTVDYYYVDTGVQPAFPRYVEGSDNVLYSVSCIDGETVAIASSFVGADILYHKLANGNLELFTSTEDGDEKRLLFRLTDSNN